MGDSLRKVRCSSSAFKGGVVLHHSWRERRGGWKEEGQSQLSKNTDLVSTTGLPKVTFTDLLLFCFIFNWRKKKRNINICISTTQNWLLTFSQNSCRLFLYPSNPFKHLYLYWSLWHRFSKMPSVRYCTNKHLAFISTYKIYPTGT